MSTDPAVTAAEQAVRTRVFASAAEAAVVAARSIIEAEVRERIAADIEESVADHVQVENEEWSKVCRKCRGLYGPGYWPCAAVRHAENAARIARGQS